MTPPSPAQQTTVGNKGGGRPPLTGVSSAALPALDADCCSVERWFAQQALTQAHSLNRGAHDMKSIQLRAPGSLRRRWLGGNHFDGAYDKPCVSPCGLRDCGIFFFFFFWFSAKTIYEVDEQPPNPSRLPPFETSTLRDSHPYHIYDFPNSPWFSLVFPQGSNLRTWFQVCQKRLTKNVPRTHRSSPIRPTMKWLYLKIESEKKNRRRFVRFQ